ncbi:MAG: type II toxin-antitoxin system RelE/ParE family toxin [Elusimicrobia bacterium]|nr:type II toxin-antitoxin system RelE/ParE family toxin [Elusimicrobiota bacterium]
MKLKLKKTEEFADWYDSITPTEKTRVDARLDNLISGFFGDSRSLGDGLFELKWKNGMRGYYSRKRIKDIDTIVLWGGFKATQKTDISKARRLKARYEYELKK